MRRLHQSHRADVAEQQKIAVQMKAESRESNLAEATAAQRNRLIQFADIIKEHEAAGSVPEQQYITFRIFDQLGHEGGTETLRVSIDGVEQKKALEISALKNHKDDLVLTAKKGLREISLKGTQTVDGLTRNLSGTVPIYLDGTHASYEVTYLNYNKGDRQVGLIPR